MPIPDPLYIIGALVNISKASTKCAMNKSLFGDSDNKRDTNDKEGV
jgi:hypothetical protein